VFSFADITGHKLMQDQLMSTRDRLEQRIADLEKSSGDGES
jgi:hypothetical protein